MIAATTWMALDNFMLTERSQSQKITYFVILFAGNIQKRKNILR